MPKLHHFRYEVSSAIAWRIIAELFRTFHDHAFLRIYEMRDCVGLDDCLTLCHLDMPDCIPICHFSLSSSRLYPIGVITESIHRLDELGWPETNNYVLRYLEAQDPKQILNELVDVLGIPEHNWHKVPPTTGPVLTVRLIAELAARTMLDRHGIELRCGCLDTDLQADPLLREDLMLVRKIANETPEEDRSRLYKYGRRFWIAYRRSPHGSNPKLILDLRGIVYALGETVKEIPVWGAFRSGAPIEALVSELQMHC